MYAVLMMISVRMGRWFMVQTQHKSVRSPDIEA